MQAYEFYTTAQDGFIKIPDEYVKKIGTDIRVILFSTDEPKNRKAPVRRSLGDMIGVLKDIGDIDLAEMRMERLQKYERID